MKQGKISEPRLSELKDEKDLPSQKILKSLNQANSASDNMQGWEIKKLGEVCDFKSGTTIDSKLEKSDGEIIYAKVGDMNLEGNEDYIKVSSRYVDLNNVNQNQIIPLGSIIFPKRGGAIATNKKRRIIQPTIVDLNTMALVPSKIIDKDYLFFWFKQIDLSDLSNGTSIPQINNYSFDNVYISYPKSLTEQQRIVALLDEAFAAIDKAKANAQQNLQNAKELFDSYLQGVFEKKGKLSEPRLSGLKDEQDLNNKKILPSTNSANPDSDNGEGWEEKTLGEIGNPKMCKRIFKEQTQPKGDIPFYKIGTFGKEPDAFISKEIYNEFREKYSFPKKGDILISASGTIGRCVRYNGEPAYFQDSNIVWIDNDESKVLNDFLYVFYGACNWGSTKGATISRLYNDNLKSIKISFPKSLKTQQAIVKQLDALRAKTQQLQRIYEKKLADLDELKKSILQKAFSGEL